MIVDGGHADPAEFQHGAEQFGDAHTRTCRRPNIDPAQREQAVAPIDHRHLELLLLCATNDRHRNGGEVGR